MENEIWKDVVYKAKSELRDYTGIYQVSNLGNVRGVDRKIVYSNGCVHKYPGQMLLKRKRPTDGYYDVRLYKGGRAYSVMVHKLVAYAFVPNPNNYPVIDHINTNKEDNRAENLRWVTITGNLTNPLTMAKRLPGIETANKRRLQTQIDRKRKTAEHITLQCDLDGNFIREFRSTMEVFRELGYSATAIARCCRGVRPTAFGYKWKYKTETK